MIILQIELNRKYKTQIGALDLGRVYRPHCVRSVLTTSVKILPHRPPARLIRAQHFRLSCQKVNYHQQRVRCK